MHLPSLISQVLISLKETKSLTRRERERGERFMMTHPASDELTRMEVSKVELALVRHMTGAECPNNMDRGVMDDGSHFPSFFSTDQRQI